MPQFEKHFTPDEVRKMLPQLRKIGARIQELAHMIQAQQSEITQSMKRVTGNGHQPAGLEALEPLSEMQKIITDLQKEGILLKDPLRGLFDFPTLINGDEVLLCWELSEEDLGFWHSVEDGLAGRKPL